MSRIYIINKTVTLKLTEQAAQHVARAGSHVDTTQLAAITSDTANKPTASGMSQFHI